MFHDARTPVDGGRIQRHALYRGVARSRTALQLTVAAVLVAALALVTLPTRFGGRIEYVTTSGVSMVPTYHQGDLVVLYAAGEYQVGDVVAYRSDTLNTVVMHRITAISADGQFTFKGDNNDWLDPDRPGRDQVIGRAVTSVAGGVVWLSAVRAMARVAALLALLFFAFPPSHEHRAHRRFHPLVHRVTIETDPDGAAVTALVEHGHWYRHR